MAWDFETDPEFQEKLDWVDEFVREEVEPLDLALPGLGSSRRSTTAEAHDHRPAEGARCGDQGLWATPPRPRARRRRATAS